MLVYSSSPWFARSTQSSMPASLLPPFFLITYNQLSGEWTFVSALIFLFFGPYFDSDIQNSWKRRNEISSTWSFQEKYWKIRSDDRLTNDKTSKQDKLFLTTMWQTGLCVYRNVLSGRRTLLYSHRGKRWRIHETPSWFTNAKVYALQLFLSNRRGKITKYETEPTALARQREITCPEERSHRPWIFFLVFCCSSNVLVCWFRLYSCTSVGRFFGAHPKIGLVIFTRLYNLVTGVQLWFLFRHFS